MPRSVSLMPPMAFCTLPFTWSPLPSDFSLESPNTLPATSFTLPLALFSRTLDAVFVHASLHRSPFHLGDKRPEFHTEAPGQSGWAGTMCRSSKSVKTRQKARGPLSLRSPTVPASTAVPAAAAKQQNDNYYDEKSGYVHVSLLIAVRFVVARAPPDAL